MHVQEAVRHAHTAFTELKVPDHVKKLMDDEKCTNLTTTSSDFWIVLAALKRFVVWHSLLLLPTAVPACKPLCCSASCAYICEGRKAAIRLNP